MTQIYDIFDEFELFIDTLIIFFSMNKIKALLIVLCCNLALCPPVAAGSTSSGTIQRNYDFDKVVQILESLDAKMQQCLTKIMPNKHKKTGSWEIIQDYIYLLYNYPHV